MSNVEFSEEESFNRSMSRVSKRESGRWTPAKLAVRLGLAKDETGVNIILVGAAVVAVVLAVIIFVSAK